MAPIAVQKLPLNCVAMQSSGTSRNNADLMHWARENSLDVKMVQRTGNYSTSNVVEWCLALVKNDFSIWIEKSEWLVIWDGGYEILTDDQFKKSYKTI